MDRATLILVLMASSLACAERLGKSALREYHSDERISSQERQALAALYQATDGNNWKNHDGWMGPVGTECTWYGVECGNGDADAATVVNLILSQNNLHGRIPDAIAQLTHLESFVLYGNDLSGKLPEPLLQRWLSGSLWVTAEEPLLTDVSEIDYESASSSVLCERHRVVIRSDRSAVLFTERCRNASPKDRRTFCEVKKGHIWGEEFARLAWTLDKNGYFALQTNYQRNITDSVFFSTRVIRSGKRYEVVEYAGGGPLELWMIHQAIEGVSSSAEWEKREATQKCPRWDESQVPSSK
jgi:hypothetical protein